jgi:hypothetical protein
MSKSIRAPMRPADRRFIAVVVAAWLLAYGAIIAFVLRIGLPAHADASLLAFGFIYVGLAAAVLAVVLVAIPLRIVLNLALKDRRRSHRTETIALCVALVAVIGYPLEIRRERNRLAPPSGVNQLSDFAEAAPPPRRLELVRHDGDKYLVWFGALSGPLDVPSGPSCYLFDQKGRLIDWQPDTGDGGPVESFLSSSSRTGEISLMEALNLTLDSHTDDADDRRE